jgi:hypothetical protein
MDLDCEYYPKIGPRFPVLGLFLTFFPFYRLNLKINALC